MPWSRPLQVQHVPWGRSSTELQLLIWQVWGLYAKSQHVLPCCCPYDGVGKRRLVLFHCPFAAYIPNPLVFIQLPANVPGSCRGAEQGCHNPAQGAKMLYLVLRC